MFFLNRHKNARRVVGLTGFKHAQAQVGNFFGDTDEGLLSRFSLRYFPVVKGFKLDVVFKASNGSDVKGATDVIGAAFRDGVISTGFTGLIDFREESDVTDEAFTVGVCASVGTDDGEDGGQSFGAYAWNG